MDEFYEIFPTPVALYKYKDSVDDELNYLKSIQYISKKANGNKHRGADFVGK